eukprot:11839681-Ditylum_brightwellii.AAC.1
MEGKWLKVLIQDLQTIQGKSHLVNTWVVKSQYKNYQHLMDVLCKSQQVAEHHVTPLNYCRLYLCITCISDITTSDGKSILLSFLNGPPPQCPKCKFNLDLPKQGCPDEWA